SRLADLTGGKVQVDEGGILGCAATGLVKPHGIERQCGASPAKPSRALDDVDGGYATDFLCGLGRELMYATLEFGKTLRMLCDVIAIYEIFPDHHIEHGVKQGHVAAGCDGQMQVGDIASVGTSRIDDDDFHGWPLFLGPGQAPEQDGMG